MLWASAYGGMVLALAQQHGVEVPKDNFDPLLNYLGQQLRSAGTDSSDLSDCCLSLRARPRRACQPAYHEKLYSLREKLSTEDRALLALAIAESRGPAEMIGDLLVPARLRARAMSGLAALRANKPSGCWPGRTTGPTTPSSTGSSAI